MSAKAGLSALHDNKILTFAALDDYAFSCARQIVPVPAYIAGDLGPQIELAILGEQGLVARGAGRIEPPWMRCLQGGAINRLLLAGEGEGAIRLSAEPMTGTEWTRLSIATKRAARSAGFSEAVAGQLSVAVDEVASNIYEHSQAPDTGLLAFKSTPGVFEFVVADQGVGALATLRTNLDFSGLASAREALPLVMREGCSRFRNGDRGNGFKNLFRGLANHKGALRFRSGDAAVLIDGQSPSPIRPKIKPKVEYRGFFAAVRCLV
jgi:hypothetical protein